MTDREDGVSSADRCARPRRHRSPSAPAVIAAPSPSTVMAGLDPATQMRAPHPGAGHDGPRERWHTESMPDLDRFLTSQDPIFPTVLAELRAGRKQSHWMWFIFPQLSALGRSPTAKFYGLAGLDEARAYLGHPILGPRLVTCTRLVNAVEGKTAQEIFGSPDDLKFR